MISTGALSPRADHAAHSAHYEILQYLEHALCSYFGGVSEAHSAAAMSPHAPTKAVKWRKNGWKSNLEECWLQCMRVNRSGLGGGFAALPRRRLSCA